jgi:hypothetical protein
MCEHLSGLSSGDHQGRLDGTDVFSVRVDLAVGGELTTNDGDPGGVATKCVSHDGLAGYPVDSAASRGQNESAGGQIGWFLHQDQRPRQGADGHAGYGRWPTRRDRGSGGGQSQDATGLALTADPTIWGGVIVTDDLSSYPVVAHELELKRQICRFHALRQMILALKKCKTVLGETSQETIDEVRRILRDLPKDGPHLLYLLWKRIVPPKGPRTPEGDALVRLHFLILKASENWQQYALFLVEEGVPTTNNATERAIGRWRSRSRTTRGFKSLPGLTAAFLICNGMYA